MIRADGTMVFVRDDGSIDLLTAIPDTFRVLGHALPKIQHYASGEDVP